MKMEAEAGSSPRPKDAAPLLPQSGKGWGGASRGRLVLRRPVLNFWTPDWCENRFLSF